MSNDEGDGIRIDKWLWYTRFFKSRTLAGKFAGAGKVRVNEKPTPKAHAQLNPGDVLTFVRADRVRVVKVVALGTRRGPAAEAQSLYEDLSPAPAPRNKPAKETPQALREPGSGRPTKAERRAIDKLRPSS